ncbi:MAG: DUF3365 domain-containing protein [Saprospiraceae bacterium]
MKPIAFPATVPNAAIDNRVAPPMEAVKRHYITSETTADAFADALVAFLKDPSKERSIMPGAVAKFGLMPKMNFQEEQVRAIAQYIYHTELEKPDWFEAHYQQERKKYKDMDGQPLSPLEKGSQLAMQTKGALGKNLLAAMNEGGPVHALGFCNTRAIPLTDSVSTALNARIRRVSDRNRNPDNAANEQELAYIQLAKAAIAAGEEAKAQLIVSGNRHIGYYPIMTNDMCLKCHGTVGETISPETLSEIHKYYPNDKAVGYKANELRGIFVVEMLDEADK